MQAHLSFFFSLHQQAQMANVRYCIVLRGEQVWAEQWLLEFYDTTFNDVQSVAWLGKKRTDGFHSLTIKQGAQLLGRESMGLVYDAHEGFDANSFNAATGTLVGGGLCFLCLPPQQNTSPDRFSMWFERQMEAHNVVIVEQGLPLPQLPPSLPNHQPHEPLQYQCCHQEQLDAVEGIIRVVTGHRKRPLVLTADRGRGKSAALGIAAAQLMQSRSIRILITAPSFKAVGSVFEHALRLLPSTAVSQNKTISFAGSTLDFIAPDELLLSPQEADLVLVDEAAAIPEAMLTQFLNRYSRMAFSSTIHGYEGTGRGFAIKFQQSLNELTPNWRKVSLSTPVRWADHDPLEQWLFDVFLFNADLAGLGEPTERELADIRIELMDQSDLVADKQRLGQLFSILVNAHYQTSPNDLVQMLNDEAVDVWAVYAGSNIVGCSILCQEGGLEPELVQQIVFGARRPAGHLIPSSIANYLQLPQAAMERCVRIMRIALHPSFQNHGIGSSILTQLAQHYRIMGFDYLGTSFGATADLLNFWFSNGFTPVRLGVSRDQASGTFSLLAVSPLSSSSSRWLVEAQQQFGFMFSSQLVEQYRALEPKLVNILLTATPAASTEPLPSSLQRLIKGYADGRLGYDLVIGALEPAFYRAAKHLDSSDRLSLLAIRKICQRHSWRELCEEFSLQGRRQAEGQLRKFTQDILLPLL